MIRELNRMVATSLKYRTHCGFFIWMEGTEMDRVSDFKVHVIIFVIV